MNHQKRIEQALLSLKGLSLGDAFGQNFFIEQDKAIELINTRQLPNKPWFYTDDTVMGISIVDTLKKYEQIDQGYIDQMLAQRYKEEPNCGYGSNAARTLRKISDKADWKQLAINAFSGVGSMGNGGAMRAAPIGAYFFDDYQKVAHQAKVSCEVTHAHPDAQAGTIAIAVAAAYCVRQRLGLLPFNSDKLLETVIKLTPQSDTLSRIKRANQIPFDSRLDYVISLLGNGSHLCSYDTVPIALWFMAGRECSFENTLWNSVAVLGDRDTICAIVGSLMALVVGREKLPKTWIERCEPLPSSLYSSQKVT
ncbi:MAG: ADP-ribosylglycohydrolase family protein [Pleurocapsa sp.]